MDMEDDLPFPDDAFTVSPEAREDVEIMRRLLGALEKCLDPAAGGGDPFPCSAWSMTFRQAAIARVREMMIRTEDILEWLGRNKPAGQKLVGFSMETENLLENSRKKLMKKHADLIAANSLCQEGAGFGTDTNQVTLISREGERVLPLLSKEDTAQEILNEVFRQETDPKGIQE